MWKRHPWLRRTLQLAAGLAGGLALVCVYGWRVGFEALPPPAPLTNRSAAFLPPDAAPPSSNIWHHIRAVGRQYAAAPGEPMPPRYVRRLDRSDADDPVFARFGPQHSWGEERGTLVAAIEAALAAPDLRPPATLSAADTAGFHLLLAAALQRAAESMSEGDAATALERLLDVLDLYAPVAVAVEFPELFDERGGEEVNVLVARRFRELALRSSDLPAEAWGRLFERLPGVETRARSAARAYDRLLARDQSRIGLARKPDWARVRRSVRMAGMLVRQDAGRLMMDLFEHLVGRRRGGEPNYHGAAHALRPFDVLCAALQTAAAQETDFQAMEQAIASRTLEALAEGRLPPREQRPAWLPDPAPVRSGWRQTLDRPAVWRLTEVFPDPRSVLESRLQWQVYLESCRLTLALRVFHQRTGRWPDRLEELVPGILPAVPRDPFATQPFRYERVGEGWRFWSVGPDGRANPDFGETAIPQYSFPHPGRAGPVQDPARPR